MKNTMDAKESLSTTPHRHHANGDTTLIFKRPQTGPQSGQLVIGVLVLLFFLLVAGGFISINGGGGYAMVSMAIALLLSFVLYRMKVGFTTEVVKVIANEGLRTPIGNIPFADVSEFVASTDVLTHHTTLCARLKGEKGLRGICTIEYEEATDVVAILDRHWAAWKSANPNS